jgi:hypothetical protein
LSRCSISRGVCGLFTQQCFEPAEVEHRPAYQVPSLLFPRLLDTEFGKDRFKGFKFSRLK